MLYIFINANTEQAIDHDYRVPAVNADILAAEIAAKHGLQASEVLVYQEDRQPFNVPDSELVVTVSGGVVTDVQPAAEPSALWVHFTITGGIVSPSGTRYLKGDGVDALAVAAELRDGPELATSNPVTQIGGADITDLWALELVNAETGVIADTPLVQMTAGAINATYKTTIDPCVVRLDESRFEMIGPYVVKLAEPVEFKIVRELT
jgi:hypothetical protein